MGRRRLAIRRGLLARVGLVLDLGRAGYAQSRITPVPNERSADPFGVRSDMTQVALSRGDQPSGQVGSVADLGAMGASGIHDRLRRRLCRSRALDDSRRDSRLRARLTASPDSGFLRQPDRRGAADHRVARVRAAGRHLACAVMVVDMAANWIGNWSHIRDDWALVSTRRTPLSQGKRHGREAAPQRPQRRRIPRQPALPRTPLHGQGIN